ncbi:MAG: chromosomal replication initiator protein DnaA [Prevotella sp.]|nr:chromosomal replication initiator protein DnaA [Prevotella sp.]
MEKVNIDIKQQWSKVLQTIKNNIGEKPFATWFKCIHVEAYDQRTNTIVLQTPSNFVYEYIEEHHIDLLVKALEEQFQKKIRIVYRSMADQTNKKTQMVESDMVRNDEKIVKKEGANLSPTLMETVMPTIDPQLNPKKSFENYIEGKSNRLSRAVGMSIAENKYSTNFNPLFVYGPSGCGKTHLINAIGLETKRRFPEKRVLYISARLFQVQFADATRSNTTPDFIRFYQTIDLLIVDDIQEWMTAEKTQNAFFHIFDHLIRNGKRIILASDRLPADLNMPDRLTTRFSGGLISEIERPDKELCINILNNKIRRDGLEIPQEVVNYIANSVNGSVRDLEGIINSLMAYSIVYNSDINIGLAESIIKRSVKDNNNPLTVDEIVEQVCEHLNVSPTDVSGKSRKKEIVQARQLSMYLAQKHTKMPASRIGKLIGNRDHSTVLHSCTQIEQKLGKDKGFVEEVNSIEKRFKLKTQ